MSTVRPFGRSLDEAVRISRDRTLWARGVLIEARTYKRDKDGRFGSGGGGSVRQSLSDAGTATEVAAAASAEAKRITGRDVDFRMEGSDVQIAREHCEGVLQGLERYPDVALDRVQTASMPFGYQDAWAVTVGGSTITFNRAYAADPAGYRQSLAKSHTEGHLLPDGPTGVALHEFGHALFHPGAGGFAGGVVAEGAAKAAGETPSAHIRREVSGYATSSGYELGAEAFADVMLHGSGASPLSHRIVDIEVQAAQR